MTTAPSCDLRHLVAAATCALLVAAPTRASAQRLVAPRTALVDEVLTVRATGLRPGARVIVRATMRDSVQRTWLAEGEYVADARGEIDLTRHPSLAGSYAGVDAMGLVTSMDLPDRPGTAVYAPPALDSMPVTYALLMAGRQIDSAVVIRRFLSPGVRAVALERTSGLVGTLFTPRVSGTTGAVLVLGGSEGGNSGADVAAL